MEDYFIYAQIIGFIAFVISTVKYQLRGSRNVLWTECLATSCWAVHVFLLGSIQAAIVNTIAVCRGTLCLKLPLRYTPYLVGGAFTLATILIIPTIEKPADMMPLLGFGFFGLSFLFQANPFRMRLSCIAGDSIWMLYALIIFSPPLAMTCALSIISSCIGLYRFEREKLAQLLMWRQPRTYP
jgi:hypothetical protein